MRAVLAGLVLAGSLVVATARPAHADTEIRGRRGATFGVSLGGGQMGCQDDECDTLNGSGSLDLHAGAMLQPNVAIVGDLWGMAHTDDQVTFSQWLLTAGIRFWPSQMIWLQGGIGVARSSFDWDDGVVNVESRSDTVPGLMGALGVEILSARTFAVDLSLRGGTGFYDDDTNVYNLALGLGISFY